MLSGSFLIGGSGDRKGGREAGSALARRVDVLARRTDVLVHMHPALQPFPGLQPPLCSPTGHHEAPGLVLPSASPSTSPSCSPEHFHSLLASLVCNLSIHPSLKPLCNLISPFGFPSTAPDFANHPFLNSHKRSGSSPGCSGRVSRVHVQRSEAAPEVCHSAKVLDDPIFSSNTNILAPACVSKGEGTGDSTGLFPSMHQKSGHTLPTCTLASFCIYTTLCLLPCKLHPCERRSPGCAKP